MLLLKPMTHDRFLSADIFGRQDRPTIICRLSWKISRFLSDFLSPDKNRPTRKVFKRDWKPKDLSAEILTCVWSETLFTRRKPNEWKKLYWCLSNCMKNTRHYGTVCLFQWIMYVAEYAANSVYTTVASRLCRLGVLCIGLCVNRSIEWVIHVRCQL